MRRHFHIMEWFPRISFRDLVWTLDRAVWTGMLSSGFLHWRVLLLNVSARTRLMAVSTLSLSFSWPSACMVSPTHFSRMQWSWRRGTWAAKILHCWSSPDVMPHMRWWEICFLVVVLTFYFDKVILSSNFRLVKMVQKSTLHPTCPSVNILHNQNKIIEG